jgi:hypothetical protein
MAPFSSLMLKGAGTGLPVSLLIVALTAWTTFVIAFSDVARWILARC